MSRILTAVLAVLLCAGLSGCDPAGKPKPKVVLKTAIETRPIGARCRATGSEGRGRGVTTPALILLADLTPPVRLVCRLDGYWPVEMRLSPRERKPLLNRLLDREPVHPARGEVRGADAGIGGGYPARVFFRLSPDRFASEAERDRIYDGLTREAQEDWARLMRQAEAECAAGVVPATGAGVVSIPKACRRAFETLRQERAKDLQRLVGERRRAAVP